MNEKLNEKLNDEANDDVESDAEESLTEDHNEEFQKSDLSSDLSKEHFDEMVREKDQFRSIAQRAQADLVNYRNRASQELEEAQRTIKFGLLTRFLSVADDLSRAIDGVPDNADQNWSEGILLVLRNLENIFELEGVKKIEAKGIQFDPYRHEALLYDKTEEADEGEIITVIEEGYSINDRILRPSRVVVAQSPRVEQTANGELTTDQTTEQEGE